MNSLTYIATTIALLFPGYVIKEGHPQQIHCMAMAVYHESRDQFSWGQIAVAHVVKNRMKSGYYPSDACNVVFQKDQFTGLTPDIKIRDKAAWDYALRVSISVYAGLIPDPTNGATMYYNPKLANPDWNFQELDKAADIQDHSFYKEKRV